jgi:hypothetical protein
VIGLKYHMNTYTVELWLILDGVGGQTAQKLGTYTNRARTAERAVMNLQERLGVSTERRWLGCYMSAKKEFRVIAENDTT